MIYNPFIKRVLDIFFAATALILLLPLFGMISILVKTSSNGPVFFIQERVGQGMRVFKLIKFRSMTCRPPSLDAEFNPGDVCHVTAVGAFLRNTKLDEIPGLFNVLKGEMSIVGPRPEVLKYVHLFSEEYRKILVVRPGLSDKASIKYRNEEALLAVQSDPEAWYRNVILPDKIRHAKKYVNRITFTQDVGIVLGTIKCLISR